MSSQQLVEKSIQEIQEFLNTQEADYGLNHHLEQVVSFLCEDDDEAFRIFSNVITMQNNKNDNDNESTTAAAKAAAARSYRAMNILKSDIENNSSTLPSILVKKKEQAGLLTKDLITSLGKIQNHQHQNQHQFYTIRHVRELLDSLLKQYPERVLASTASGGKRGVQELLEPLFISPMTLNVLTNLVCYGCTGRQGMPSAEKSAAHTPSMMMMYQQQQRQSKPISAGARKKFIRQMSEFQLFDRLSMSLREIQQNKNDSSLSSSSISSSSGEEICETLLTILEVVGYPPDDDNNNNNNNNNAVAPIGGTSAQVGEDLLLSPLTTSDWWKDLLLLFVQENEQQHKNDDSKQQQQQQDYYYKKEAVARTLHSAFALATGNSSRIVKSHAPATDATEQQYNNNNNIDVQEEEKEEKIRNRLIEWNLTDRMHDALLDQFPLLLQALDLPTSNILTFQATTIHGKATATSTVNNDPNNNTFLIRHPGRYQTVPIGSWRVQLLSLLKEIICYKGKDDDCNSNKALDALMELPLPPELLKTKKQNKNKTMATEDEQKEKEEETGNNGSTMDSSKPIYNPWPALSSYVFAYPYNDFYHNIFYQMLQAVVLDHHEPTLRVILQKSKFLSRALQSLTSDNDESSAALRGLMIRILNLLRLRSQSLPPNAFLTQYLSSHDLWKQDMDQLVAMTLKQETPIRLLAGGGAAAETSMDSIELGSSFANKLGLGGITKWEQQEISTEGNSINDGPSSVAAASTQSTNETGAAGGKKKKNNKKKKKKK